MTNTSKSAKQSSRVLQSDIRMIMADISRRQNRNTLHTSKQNLAAPISRQLTGPDASKSVAKTPVTSKSTGSRTSSEIVKTISVQQAPNTPNQTQGAKKMLENVYARELFFRHTDITQVLARMLPERSENTRKRFAAQLYTDYVLEPRKRICKYLEEVRFDTRYNEGLFHMAIKVPITSAQELTAHRQKLANAGIRKLCFVDMTVNNLVLEHQEKLVETLKERFNNWSAKLGKLSAYITMYQQQREADDRKFVSQLKRHSSMKGSWLLGLPEVVEELVRESRIPSEQRKNLFWSTLRFDDDALNKKYETGAYCRLQNDLDRYPPEELIEYQSLRTIGRVQEEIRDEDRELQLFTENDNSSSVQSNDVGPVDQRLPVEQTSEPQSSSAPHRENSFNLPVSAMLIPNETWEREIEISQQPSSVQRTKHPQNRPHFPRVPCKVRAGCISYEDSLNSTNNAPNQSIAFVPVAQDSSQQSPLANTEIFTPFVTSTQNQSQSIEFIEPAATAAVPASTQDPLQLSGTVISTMSPPSDAIVPPVSGITPTTNIMLLPETINQDSHSQTPTQLSSTIAPFQALKPTPSGSFTINNVTSLHMKQETLSDLQSQADSSGYEDYVECIPSSPSYITIDSDSDTDQLI